MTSVSPAPDRARSPAAADDVDFDALIRRDQLVGVRRSLKIALPVNVTLSAATLGVALEFGRGEAGAIWFACTSLVNLARFLQIRLRLPRGRAASTRTADRQLFWASVLAFLSGSVWACTPLLASQPLGADAMFHLIVGAGITGGSIAMAFSHAPIAIGFVVPILGAHALSLLASSSVSSIFLASTVAIYMLALCRSAMHGANAFRTSTRLKHEATTLARSLREAHAQKSAVAEEMSHRARHDSLTGLLNRAGFLQEIERRGADRSGSARSCCLMLLDLDGFKSINDTFGHQVGDRVLIEVARRIGPILPADAAVARLGGDEFAVTFDPSRSDRPASALAEELIAVVGARFASFDAGRLGVSVGIYEGRWPTSAELLVYADEALYAAKGAGRNQHRFFDEQLKQRLEIRRDSERDLLAALDSRSVQMWFQPVFGDGGRRVSGVEALLRWRHPRHGAIPPGDIVSAAALSGNSERLLCFVIDGACAMARSLRSLGRPDVKVAINVSPREMSRLPVDTLVMERLGRAGLPASCLEIEITEETALDIRAVQGKLANLSEAGIRIAIDDFGVGYSSLSSLRQLHADRVKIDRCFVTGLASSPDNRTLLQAVVSLGRAMSLDVVAEGVESAHDVIILRALGCQFMQGFHLGKPMPAHEVLTVVAQPSKPSAATAA